MSENAAGGQVDVLFIDVKFRTEESEKSLRELEQAGQKAGAKTGTSTGDAIADKLKDADGKLKTTGKQLGDSVTDGMAQGVKSGTGKVEAAADDATKGIKGKLKNGLSGAFDALDGAGISSSITDIGSALTGAAGPAALLTVGLTAVAAAGAFIASSIDVYAELEKELNALKAVSGATADEMGRLKGQALELGQSTSYSATEVVKVQQELSKAGVSIKDILTGATEGTLLLASATGSELAQALDVTTKAMNVFNLTGADVAHIADVISNGANQSALDVGTFGTALQAMGKVGPQAGLGLEQTTAVLSLFADNALEGSDAGTSLKTMLLALLAPSDKAAAQLEQMGVNVYESHQKLNDLGVSIKDSDGNLRPFAAIISDLNNRFATMTEEQRNAAMATIFGSDAVRAAGILYDEGSAKLFDYTTKMYETGTASDNAKTRQEGLRGAQEQLGGAMETLQANVGQYFTPSMTKIIEGATAAATAVSGLFGWMDKLAHGTPASVAAVNQDYLQNIRSQQVLELRNQEGWLARASSTESRGRIAGLITEIKARIHELDTQIAVAKATVDGVATEEEAARQSAPGWQGPRMGPQTLPNGSGIFSAIGVNKYRITQELGEHPENPAYKPFPGKPFAGHEGVDVATPIGTPIEAGFTGMLQTKTSAAYGKYIELVDEKGQKLILAHLSAYATGLEAQVKAAGGRLLVSAGQKIGFTGNTGNSTGPHLHAGGVTADGRYVDPRSLDYAGMAKPTFQPGTGAQTAPDWDKLIARAKELKGVFDSAKPGTQAAILASDNIAAFKKSSDAAKSAYSEIERAAGLAGKKIKETDEQHAQRIYREKVAQDALTSSLRGASEARLQELEAQGVSGQSLNKWEAVRAEIARREQARVAQGKKDATDLKQQQQEAARNADAAGKQADQLAGKAAGGVTEAARIRTQSLAASRDQAVQAAGTNLKAVLAVQQAFAPKIQAAAEQEAQVALAARKLSNDQWRTNQEEAARKTITNQSQLTARLGAIESGWRTENSNAYRVYYSAVAKASTDAATVVEQAGQRANDAATRQAEAASKQADELASKASGSAAEAARIRTQSLATSRSQAVQAAGSDLKAVLEVQTAYAPRIQAAAAQESQATLSTRKLANDQWRGLQEEAARKTITNQTQLTARLAVIESAWKAENSNAYRVYYSALGQASIDAATVVEEAGQRVADAAAKQAQAVSDSRYQLSAGLVRYSFGEGEGGLTAALKTYGVKDVSDVQAALTELDRRAPKTAALIREAYGGEIEQLAFFAEQSNRSSAQLSQASIERIQAAQEESAGYGETLTMLSDLLGRAIGLGLDPRESGYLNVLDALIEKGGDAAAAALYVKNNLNELLDVAGATDLGTILFRGQKAIREAQERNAAPAPEGTTLEQSNANSLSGDVLSQVFSGSATDQLFSAVSTSLGDVFNRIGADGREEFWSRFGDLTASTEYKSALNGLSSVQLYDLISQIGDAPEWADLKAVLSARFAEATTFPVTETNVLEKYLDSVITTANEAKAALDAGSIDPQEYLTKVSPLVESLGLLAVNLERIGSTDAASSVRDLIKALSGTTDGMTDPTKLANSTALAAANYQAVLRLNGATADAERAAYQQSLAAEVKFWEDRVEVLKSIGGPAYLAAIQKLIDLKGTLDTLDLSVTVKVFGVDTGIKELDFYKSAIQGVAGVISKTFENLVAGTSDGVNSILVDMALMALGIVKQVAVAVAAYEAQAIAMAIIRGGAFDFVGAALMLAGAATIAGIVAGLESRLTQKPATSVPTTVNPAATSTASTSATNNLIDVPNSAVTVMAAPSWVPEMGRHIDRMGGYINRLVTEGIHVHTDKGGSGGGSGGSGLAWELGKL